MTPEQHNRLDGPTLADMAEAPEPPMTFGARVFWVAVGVTWAALLVMVWRWVYG